jgi:hypothetical protein
MKRIKLSHLIVGVLAGAALAGGGYAIAASSSSVIHACINRKTRVVTIPKSGRCGSGSSAIAWNQVGPRGPAGVTGGPVPQGPPVLPGPRGPPARLGRV